MTDLLPSRSIGFRRRAERATGPLFSAIDQAEQHDSSPSNGSYANEHRRRLPIPTQAGRRAEWLLGFFPRKMRFDLPSGTTHRSEARAINEAGRTRTDGRRQERRAPDIEPRKSALRRALSEANHRNLADHGCPMPHVQPDGPHPGAPVRKTHPPAR